VELLSAFARETGAALELQEVLPGQKNCILTYDFGAGKTLAFNTHMDVNNPSGQRWAFDPFAAFEKEGKLYGLGACDAKGSLAAFLTAIEALLGEKKPSGKLILTAVMGEEAGGLGSLHLAEKGFKADGAVVGEPTSLKVCTAHKGTYMRRLYFRGKAYHSASSRKGINAITHAARFCCLYDELSGRLEKTPHPVLGPADASVTLISGGTRQNTIPEICQVLIDRRLLPGETREMADLELREITEELKRQVPDLNMEKIETIVSTVPSETKPDAEIVKIALDCLSRLSGEKETPQGFNAGCDMSKLNLLCGIPTIIFGPGDLANAHAPDEFVRISDLEAAAAFYEKLARRFFAAEN
jgi:acetylornithine deacetylase/succinyl-diaminopimelate desuccinylase family protein